MPTKYSGSHFNIETVFFRYRISMIKIRQWVLSYNGNSYTCTGKTACLYWDSLLVSLIIIQVRLTMSMWCKKKKKKKRHVNLFVATVMTVKTGGRFKNTYELLNLKALKISKLHKNHIFQCMGKIFCVEFQRVPLKFHTKYLTHTLKDVDFIHIWKFKSS